MLLSFFPASSALAAACASAATGNWSAPATWSSCGGGVPGAADTVTINATHTVTLTADAAAASITINAASAANGITLGGFTLNVSGAITMTAPSSNVTSTFNVGTGTLTAASITINGGNSSRVSLMTVSSGTITTTGSIAFAGAAGNARFTSTGAGTVNVGGNFGSGGTLTTSGTGTINFNGGAAQTIGAYITYNNVTINNSAGGVTLAGAVTIGGTLNVTRGTFSVGTANFLVNGPTNIGNGTLVATIDQSSATGTAIFVGLVTVYPSSSWTNSSSGAVTFRGGITNNGTFSAGTAVQTFDTNSQVIGGSSAIAIPSITVTGVTLTNNGTLTVATALAGTGGGLTNSSTGTLNIGGTSSVATITNAGTANISGTGAITTATLTNTGTLNLSGTNTITAITNSTGGTLNISSTSTITTLTATAAGNIVNYTGAGAQTIKATTYATLGTSGAGVKTNSGTVTVNTALSGTALTNTGTLNIGGTSTITTLTATAAGNIVNYTGAGAQTIIATTYATLGTSGAGVKTNSGIVTVNTALTGTALTNTGTLNIGGTSTITTLTATAAGNIVNYTGAAAQTINATTYDTLGTNGAGVKTNSGTVTVNTALTGTALTNTGTLNIGGTSTITTLNASTNPNTVNYTGAGAQTIIATTYDTLGTSGAGVKTNSGTVTVNTALTGTALTNTGTLNIGGTSTITTLNASTNPNTVNYTGAAAQTIKATTYDTLGTSGAGVKTNSGTVTVNTALTGTALTNTGTLNIGGTSSIAALTNTGTLNLSGTGSITAITNNAGGTLNISGTSTITTLTATTAGNTVNYTGAAAQTIKATTYATLGISGAGVKTNSGTVTVNTALTGTALTNTGTLNIGGTSTITTLNASTNPNTVNYTGAAAQTINATTYDTLGTSGAGVKTNSGTVTVNTALSGTALTNTGTLNIGGTVTITTLTATAAGNTVNYTGAAQTVKATTYHHLSLGGSGAKTMAATTVNGNFSLTGTATTAPSGALAVTGSFTIGVGTTFTAGALAHSVGGNWSNSGTFTAGTSTVTFNGSAQQTFTGATTFANLTLNNAAGFAINNNMTVSTVLTMTSGTVTTSGNTLVASASCPGSISRTNGYVIGNLQLTVPATNPVTCSYPVGDSIGYAPISITKSGTNTGTLIGRVDSGDHPDGSSTVGINQLKNANHYWTLTAGTLSSATYTATFQFCATGTCVIPTEIDNGAATGNFIVTEKSGTWSSQTVGTQTSTSTQATGLTSFGVFEVGEVVYIECISQATGNWSAPGTWTGCRGGIPLAGDSATIANSHNVTLNVNTPTLNSLTINSGGTLTNTGSNTITLSNAMLNAGAYSGGSGAVIVPGTFINTGSYSAGSAATTLSGNFSNSGTFTAGTGTWTFSGSSAQSITGVTSFYNLTDNNSSGISLNDSVSVSHLLTLSSGNITTGANSISVLTATCPGSISRTSGFVIGKLRLTFPTASTTCTYYVGSGTTYAPIGVTLTGGGTLTGSTAGNEHPQVANSGIDSTLDVNRYWSLWSSGDTVNASSYSPTFNFNAGDADALATPTRFVVGKYTGSAWSLITPPSGSALATSTAVSITAAITAPTDFISGEATFVCSVPSGSPAGTTCVCDNFTRTILNPSTIYSGNWQVSSSGIHAFLPQIVNNRLRLTDGNGSESTAATGPGAFPAAGNWVTAEFKHYAYGGTGADGIALTLSDSTITAVPGAFGGSLGYAQKSNPGSDCTTTGGCPGFAGGWIGIAIDEFGNFSANTEGRTGGAAPGLTVDSVSVRGSGSGLTGYPYLGGTATLSPAIDNPSPATDGFGYAYRLTVDARCYQANTISADITCNNPTLAKTALVKVERDITGTGNNYTTLLGPFDAYTVNPSQANVPINWQLSYTGSTGGSTNIHEISGMKVCAQTYTPPAGYRILVDNFSPTTCASDPQPTVTISALDSNSNIITTYTKTVNLSATLLGGASSANWTSQGTNHGTFDAVNKRYTFAAGDNGVAKFTLSDTSQQNVYVTISEYLGTLNSTLGIPVQYSSGVASFVVSIPDALAQSVSSTSPDPVGGGVVAGRAHLMRITRNTAVCGGGADTTFTGTKLLDGWYNPALPDHPTGAVAPQICAPVSGACQPSYVTGSCETLSIAAPALSSSSNNLSLTFTSGVANFCLVTSDVGKYTIDLRDDTTAPASPVYGASTTLTARPFAVAVSNIVQGATPNPSGNTLSPSDTAFAKAGSSFQATVGGYLWNSAGDADGNGLPDSGATLTQMLGSGIAPYYGDTVVLSATTPFAPATSLDTPAGTGTSGSLSNGSVTITGGSSIPSTLSYSEVGSFTLKAVPSSNYLNSGVDLNSRVAIFSQPAYTFQSALVGRFIPDHFLLTTSTPTSACGTFTYFGQDGFKTAFTLTAVNANGTQTNNYAGDGSSSTSWAKLPLTVWGGAPASANSAGYGFAASAWLPSQPVDAALAASAIQPTATPTSITLTPTNTWVSGSTYITAQHQITRPANPSAPTTVNVTALPVDSDGVTMTAAATLVTATPLRYGRLALQNAYGSELLALPMSLTAEYWNGTSWVTNTADSCTALNVPANGSGLTLNLDSSGTTTATLSNPLVFGDAGLSLAAPGATHTGYVDVTINSPAWLDFNWQGTGDTDPIGRATFGIYKGNSKFIYIRELY